MGIGLLFGALAGAGNSIAKSAGDYQRLQDDRALLKERSQLDEEKQLRIDEILRSRNEAPMARMGQSVSRFANEELPITADPVKTTTSAGAKAIGLQDGLVGMTREQVQAYKDPDMLAQYDKQIEADQGIAQKGLLSKTRKRTSDEALQAARDERVAAGDLQAVEAGDKANAAYIAGKRAEDRLDRADVRSAEELKFKEKQLTSREKIEAERREVDRERIEKMTRDAASSGNRAMQQAAAISLRRDISAADNAIRDLERSKKGKFDDEIADINAAIADKREERAWMVEQETKYFKDAGVNLPDRERPKDASQNSQGASKPLASLPAGAKKIGTSGGKDVYQTPDGKKFIAN